ncbi:SDR family oxidoreductase [Methylocystis sp. MJC1]|uniref:SDR family oxidoreductase n=1 Tax=Methylocystis sp. MJC1 TaxID=2654282 RepID=UPI0013EA3106|nr:SDR family oxidoreductase [Methylocystis sp. MJC1]KAF2989827.1 putative oxidoreductase SadH [Methylocystis sp. MJC1]MBU6526287.1 SDR family oxidoreductase [Methylocystis sp. MJC1]UZX12741.1 SDR family oxidoreductase [Methylocystis sp. MJC1]
MSRNSAPDGEAPVVVVTGASAGIGRAVAVAFARCGYRVALLARSPEGLDGAFHDVAHAGGQPFELLADVAKADDVFAAAEAVVARWGHIHVWVNDAMETVVAPVDAITPEEYRRVMEATFLGYVHGTLAALRHMRQRDQGHIIQIGSALSYRAIPLQSAYCAAKFAIRGFTDSLRAELIHDRSNIRLTMAQLPGVNTPQFDWSHTHFPNRHQPIGSVYEPEAIAQAIVEAAHARRAPRELWLGAPTVQSIIGQMVAPGFLDHYLAWNAYEKQISSDPVLPGDPDELIGPDHRDHGPRGRFTQRAKDHVMAVDPAHLRGGAVMAGLGLLTGAFLWGRASRPH